MVITGTNFDGVRDVKFGNTSATFDKDSATQITTYVPRVLTAGMQAVTVTNNMGTSDAKQFAVN